MYKKIGTLLPLTSLKNPNHNLITSANNFIQWLSQTNQDLWQLLPLHQTPPKISSPYSSYGIGIHKELFSTQSTNHQHTPEWLKEYALYEALSEEFQTHDWTTWPQDIKTRKPQTLTEYCKKRHIPITKHSHIQLNHTESLKSIKKSANQKGIQLIGDLPFYIPLESPLVWQFQDCFQIPTSGQLEYISGVPKGTHFPRQAWGHPLYNWKNHQRLLSLFKLRLSYLSEFYDIIRLDHAIGFFTYAALHQTNPEKDQLHTAPGTTFFEKLYQHAQSLHVQLIAEDLSDFDMTELRQTMKTLNIPGIRTFTLGLHPQLNLHDNTHTSIWKYPTQTYAYTSTHDTMTLRGYSNALSPQQKKNLAKSSQIPYHKNNLYQAQIYRQALLKSTSQATIVAYQDWVNSTERINTPGTISPENWNYTITKF